MNSNKLLLNSVLAFSILSLSIAYFIQYVLGHKPCNLCIIERVPYIAAIILISLIFLVKNLVNLSKRKVRYGSLQLEYLL